jgi:hypothetical protein
LFLAARHAASKYDCKFVETSAAINDKVDDLTITNGSIDTNDSEAPILTKTSSRKSSGMPRRHTMNVFSKFLNVFRKKPSRLPADVENLNSSN